MYLLRASIPFFQMLTCFFVVGNIIVGYNLSCTRSARVGRAVALLGSAIARGQCYQGTACLGSSKITGECE